MKKLKHKSVKQSSLFEVNKEKVKRKRRYCPRCGTGFFLAEHKDRFYCGYCHYTEWKVKPNEKK